MTYSQSNHTQMNKPMRDKGSPSSQTILPIKCLGAEAPKFYMIKHNNESPWTRADSSAPYTYTIVAMRMSNHYLFNVPNSDGHKSWQSVHTSVVDPMIKSIDQIMVDEIKKSIQSADSGAIQLLIICNQLFHTGPTILDSIVGKLPIAQPKKSMIQSTAFIPLSITDIRQVSSLDRMPWKLIYLNNLLQSRGMAPIIDDWCVVLSPQKYIFDDQHRCDTSIRLIQLRRAINQLTNDTYLSSGNIYELSRTLDESISKFDFSLPDICIFIRYPITQPIDIDMIIQSGLLLITNLAQLGVINNYSEVSNLIGSDHGISFRSYDHAILADIHGTKLDLHQIETTLNLVYKKDQSITSDPILAFNCFVMYDMIRFILSIGQSTDKTKSILSDANSIMKQAYTTNPTFDHKKCLSTAAEWIYDKHFDDRPEFNKYIVRKDCDEAKYQYLSTYLHQYD